MDFVRSYFLTNETMGGCPFSFIKIRFSYNQNIGETHFLHWVSVSPIFWLQENLILMKEMGNCPEFHLWRSNFLQNLDFSCNSLLVQSIISARTLWHMSFSFARYPSSNISLLVQFMINAWALHHMGATWFLIRRLLLRIFQLGYFCFNLLLTGIVHPQNTFDLT